MSTKVTKYTLEPGRCIVRAGVRIATIAGVTETRPGEEGPLTIGHPAALDEFAHLLVDLLNHHGPGQGGLT